MDPNKFDIDVEIDNKFLFQEPKVSIEGDTIDISLQPRGDWCECLMPNELNMKIISNTKKVAFEDEGSSYAELSCQLKLLKERTWFSRCLWVVLAIAGLLLLMLFLLITQLKKNRHKKKTMDNPDLYPNESEEEKKEGESEGQDQYGNCTLD